MNGKYSSVVQDAKSLLFPPIEQEYFCPSCAQEEWTQDDDGEDIVEVDNDVIIIDWKCLAFVVNNFFME